MADLAVSPVLGPGRSDSLSVLLKRAAGKTACDWSRVCGVRTVLQGASASIACDLDGAQAVARSRTGRLAGSDPAAMW